MLTKVFLRTMSSIPRKAIICENFGAPEVMKTVQSNISSPGPGQVLVQLSACGINPSDTYVRLGPNGPYAASSNRREDQKN